MASQSTQTTYSAKPKDIVRAWHLIDAQDKVLGRISTQIAMILKGKTKAMYTPSMDTGDFVVVINADKVKLTGTKEENKVFYSHTMFPGGLRTVNMATLRAKHPEDIILNAVRRMLPRSALGRAMFKKLKVYAGPTHPHAAQKPVALEIKGA
ncbi:MAG: 50S ribosomal protein L13 [Deltaproteobacteria bacterium]|nr:50S ribosomal protein L13 [Deltaproteobacteria bacterium]